METEGQSRQRVGGGRSFWLLCVVVVFCVVARDLGRGGTHKKCDFSNCLKIYSELSNMLS